MIQEHFWNDWVAKGLQMALRAISSANELVAKLLKYLTTDGWPSG